MQRLIALDSKWLRHPLPQKTLTVALELKALYDLSSESFLLIVSRDGALMQLVKDQTQDLKVINLST